MEEALKADVGGTAEEAVVAEVDKVRTGLLQTPLSVDRTLPVMHGRAHDQHPPVAQPILSSVTDSVRGRYV